MTTNSDLKSNQVVIGERNYEEALNIVIAQAKNELLIFDADLSRGGYNSQKRFDLINQFLAKQPQNRLTIVLLDAQYFIQYCSRLFGLLENYSHLMTVYRTNDTAKIAQDCFVIADKQHYIRRFNKDQARFKFALDDEDMSAQLSIRFNELLEETTESISYSQLGL